MTINNAVTPPPSDQPLPRKPRKWPWIVAGVFGVLWIIGAATGGSSDSNGFEARYACEQWVKQQLKAPSTADFHDGTITKHGEDSWEITGTVDAQNGFGAQIRTSWTCDVRHEGEYFKGFARLMD